MYDINQESKTEEPIVTNKIRVAIQTKKTVFGRHFRNIQNDGSYLQKRD